MCFHPCLAPLLFTGPSLHVINFCRKFLLLVPVDFGGGDDAQKRNNKQMITTLIVIPKTLRLLNVLKALPPSRFLLVKEEAFFISNVIFHN